MYLYNIEASSLVEVPTSPLRRPAYAALSHCWSERELTYHEVRSRKFSAGPGLAKLQGSVRQARQDNLDHIWLDTCCINKESSVELSEAINSMYQWYTDAKYCYVYLHDVDQRNTKRPFDKSKWFTRGWTLQELIAPPVVLFYDRKWRLLGDKRSLASDISRVTGIPIVALVTNDIRKYSVAQKMSWAAERVTTRPEDRAYSLMGLFNVNMPLLYGEGKRAFTRLQEEIIKDHDDQSIFAWSMGENKCSGLLAPEPRCFAECGQMLSYITPEGSQPFSMTNRGLSIALQITPWTADTYLAYLDCAKRADVDGYIRAGIFLRRLSKDDQYARISLHGQSVWSGIYMPHDVVGRPTRERRLFVRKIINEKEEQSCLKEREYGFEVLNEWQSTFDKSQGVASCSSKGSYILAPGNWGCVTVIDVTAEHKGLRKIALGFDFDFHPVCLLLDSSCDAQQARAEWSNPSDWSEVFSNGFEWDTIHEGSRVYRCDAHDGMWALKGHRLQGLDVLLSEPFTNQGPLVTLKRKEGVSLSAWMLDIDGLIGPSRNHRHPSLRSSFVNRRNFQASYGLDMTSGGLEEGDAILEAFYTQDDVSKQAEPRWISVHGRPVLDSAAKCNFVGEDKITTDYSSYDKSRSAISE